MKYQIHSHRYGLEILETEAKYSQEWNEVKQVLEGIADEDIIDYHTANCKNNKSISVAINNLIKERLKGLGWEVESPIFQDSRYAGNRWRLDFAKKTLSVEVAFNHGEAIAWNLIKPVLASELNHVEKAIQTEIGIYITVTADMKRAGGFDSAVGEYEKVLRYLTPLNNTITVPMVFIGLTAPETFHVEHTKINNSKRSIIVKKDPQSNTIYKIDPNKGYGTDNET